MLLNIYKLKLNIYIFSNEPFPLCDPHVPVYFAWWAQGDSQNYNWANGLVLDYWTWASNFVPRSQFFVVWELIVSKKFIQRIRLVGTFYLTLDVSMSIFALPRSRVPGSANHTNFFFLNTNYIFLNTNYYYYMGLWNF